MTKTLALMMACLLSMLTASTIDLPVNTYQLFLIENIMLRSKSYFHTGKSATRYLVINFNQFRVRDGAPDLPSVSITAMANGSRIDYFSTVHADWRFDENLVVVPLVNFDDFLIDLEWRENGFATSFQGTIGVFDTLELAEIGPNMILPGFIDKDRSDAVVRVSTKHSQNEYERSYLKIDICRGEVSKVELTDETANKKIEVPLDKLDNGYPLGKIASPSSFKVTIHRKENTGPVVYKLSLKVYNKNQKLMDDLSNHKPQLAYTKEDKLEWQNKGQTAAVQKFGIKTNILVDSNRDNLEFKTKCGFSYEILTKGYPHQPSLNLSKFIDLPHQTSHKFEFSIYTDNGSNEGHWMDLIAEQRSRFDNKHQDTVKHPYFLSMKEFYYSYGNYENGTYYYVTAYSDIVNGHILVETPAWILYIQTHTLACTVSLIVVIFVIAGLIYGKCMSDSRNDADGGRIRLPQAPADLTMDNSIEMTRHNYDKAI